MQLIQQRVTFLLKCLLTGIKIADKQENKMLQDVYFVHMKVSSQKLMGNLAFNHPAVNGTSSNFGVALILSFP